MVVVVVVEEEEEEEEDVVVKAGQSTPAARVDQADQARRLDCPARIPAT